MPALSIDTDKDIYVLQDKGSSCTLYDVAALRQEIVQKQMGVANPRSTLLPPPSPSRAEMISMQLRSTISS